jgi:glycosyltransferase involved in cell wall biosynthesis
MPPLGLCAAAKDYARRCGAKFVADVQDAWPETFERILPRFVLSLLGLYRLAKSIYTQADGISAVAKRYVELAARYGARSPSAVFGHCIETAGDAGREKRESGAALRLAYIGNMSLSYDLETLVRCVAEMDSVTLDVAGGGPDRPRLEALAAELDGGRGKIRFHPYLKTDELTQMLRGADVGVIPMFPESCVGVPGKIADYAAAGLKVAECLGGETAALLDEFGVGVHYKAGSVASLREAVEAARSLDVAGARERFARRFDAAEVMDGYVKWVSGLAHIWYNNR